jgi:hypothetical protein
MKKKVLVMAATLAASLLLTANVYGASFCGSGVNIVFNGVGSSAQANALAQAARLLTQDTANTPAYNLVSTSKGAVITDKRPTIGGVQGVTDSANPFWVIWDTKCNVYAYWTVDSGVGVKDFLAYEKFTNSSGKVYNSVAAAFGTITTTSIASTTENQVGGLADTQDAEVGVSGSDFDLIVAALNVTPEQRVATGNVLAPAYCGNTGTTTGAALLQFQCYFNVAGTDVRPEDALFATTRALTSYNGLSVAASGTHDVASKVGTGTLTGLGYNTATADSATCTPSANVGCTILDSFDQGKKFNVVNFKLTGVDPISAGILPGYTTLSVGADPVLVIVHNGAQFGGKTGTAYTYANINKNVLAQVFSGWSHCAEDLLSSTAHFPTTASPVHPMQVVQREPLSGTYNTFEFNGVRTLAGSANAAQNVNTTPPGPPISNVIDGQEQFLDPAELPGGNGTACTETGGYPQANCFNPLFFTAPVTACPGTTDDIPVRLRAIGTGEEVKATMATYNTGAGSASIDNGIGYAFWGYGNTAPMCSASGGTTTCPGSYIGHYLTVDGVDPLFANPGGPGGPNNPPYCNITGTSQTCTAIPFTHILDGSYPIWSLLRVVTFAPKSGSMITPIAVLNMIANEEIASGATGTTGADGLSDFVPFLKGVTGSATTGVWTGNLNLFVYREHYLQSSVKAANGHVGCETASPTFTKISLQGGASGASTCLVDFGGDVGGSVMSVQSDVDFILDFGTEEWNQHQ